MKVKRLPSDNLLNASNIDIKISKRSENYIILMVITFLL